MGNLPDFIEEKTIDTLTEIVRKEFGQSVSLSGEELRCEPLNDNFGMYFVRVCVGKIGEAEVDRGRGRVYDEMQRLISVEQYTRLAVLISGE